VYDDFELRSSRSVARRSSDGRLAVTCVVVLDNVGLNVAVVIAGARVIMGLDMIGTGVGLEETVSRAAVVVAAERARLGLAIAGVDDLEEDGVPSPPDIVKPCSLTSEETTKIEGILVLLGRVGGRVMFVLPPSSGVDSVAGRDEACWCALGVAAFWPFIERVLSMSVDL